MSAMSTDEPRDHHGNPADLSEYIARLDDPARDEWQRPDVVLAALGITRPVWCAMLARGQGISRFAWPSWRPRSTPSTWSRSCSFYCVTVSPARDCIT